MTSLFAILLLLLAPSADGGGAHPQPPTVFDLAWLTGCWQRIDDEPGTMEMWTPPAAGTLLGASRSVRDGRTVFHEFLMIRETDDGLEYVALPGGRDETVFEMTRLASGEIAFANPGHDFPQRIIYRLDGEDRLLARIEGDTPGGPRAIDFPMRRVDCRPAE